jgi:hypothetical protein
MQNLQHNTTDEENKESGDWNNIRLEKNVSNEDIKKITRKKKNETINPIYGHIFRICGIIIILAFWTNVYINHKKKDTIKTQDPQVINYLYHKNQPQQTYQQNSSYASDKKTIEVPPTKTNQSYKDYKIRENSHPRKVFSWIDENGLKHYSNTNYPQDNPTLKIQDEIKTQH